MNTTLETTNPHLETPPSAAPEKPRADRPNVNIAHLPKETRDMINLMLSDGLPYHILIACKPGEQSLQLDQRRPEA